MPPATTFFEGSTASPTRDVLAETVRSVRPEKLIIPACGRFASAMAVVKHGYPASKVWCSDVSLFSAVIGYLVDETRRLSELPITIPPLLAPFMDGLDPDDEYAYAAGLLVGFKWRCTPVGNKAIRNFAREILENRLKYRAHIEESLHEHVELLRGIHYEVADPRSVLAAAESEPETSMLFLDAPAITPDSERQFASWEADLGWTGQAHLSTKETAAVVDPLRMAPLFVMIGEHYNGGKLGLGWHEAFAVDMTQNRFKGTATTHMDYLKTNRPPPITYAEGVTVERAKYQPLDVYADQEITPRSTLHFAPIDEATALHYRDLFVHRLKASRAEMYHGMFVDDRLVAVCGFYAGDIRLRREPWDKMLGEMFGVSVTSKRYSQLGRLLRLAITSGDLRRYIMALYRWSGFCDIEGIQATTLSPYPEGKLERGIMKLVKREKTGEGYRLLYETPLRDDTWADVMKLWCKKYGRERKPEENDDGGSTQPSMAGQQALSGV